MDAATKIGVALKEAREKAGLSWDDVVKETKIRSKYIIALESGDFRSIPGEVYVKGFIRSYAKLLQLDGEALVEDFRRGNSEATSPESPAVPIVRTPNPVPVAPAPIPVPVAPAPKPVPPRQPESSVRAQSPVHDTPSKPIPARKRESSIGSSRPVRFRARPGFYLVLFLIIALSVALFKVVLPAWRTNPPAPPVNTQTDIEPEVDPVDNGNGEEDPVVVPPLPTVTVTEDSPQRTVFAVTSEQLTVTMVAREPCWVEVRSDNQSPFSLTIPAGENREYQAGNQLTLWVGNPGGISLIVNGNSMELPGEPKQPKRLIFQRQ